MTAPRGPIATAFCTTQEALGRRVVDAYNAILGRTPAPSEVIGYIPALEAGILAFPQLRAQLFASEEFWLKVGQSPQEWVNKLYLIEAGRPPDPAGFSNWLSQLVTLPMAAQPSPISATGMGGQIWAAEQARNLAVIAQGPANIVFLGDSITDWFTYKTVGVPTSGAGARVWNESFAPLGCINLGIAGLTTAEVLWQASKLQVTAVSPKAVVLMIGTNNLGVLDQSPGEVAEATAVIVQSLMEQAPTLKVLVVGILPRGHRTDPLRNPIAQTNAATPIQLAGTGATFLDLTASFTDLMGNLLPGAFQTDNLHITEYGYTIERSGIWTWVKNASGV